ncbi:hypothetical protein ACFQNF_07495 [Iodobacter arcticus]|uniref:Fungal lipase-type domain-containing protein n=1 Tax=Iodobacter arcticus TaxID=590593 RepID=A0ABW2QW70_9NEIS
MTNFNYQQLNLALSYIAAAGQILHQPTPERIHDEIETSLQNSQATKGEFDIVWGPAMYRYQHSLVDDNLMMVVKSKNNDSDYRVVVRATNTCSLFDWIVEDLWVNKTVPWSKYDPLAPAQARISKGTDVGMSVLLNLYVSKGLAGAGTDLLTYLQEIIATSKKRIDLTVVGHSLGGALSASLGLYLASKLNDSISLSIQASAGPTAGNCAFAEYSHQKLGNRLLRLHNSLDIVPHAWSANSLEQLHQLYYPTASFPKELENSFKLALAAARINGYTQLLPEQILSGVINDELTNYAEQARYQHVDAYAILLGMTMKDFEISNYKLVPK